MKRTYLLLALLGLALCVACGTSRRGGSGNGDSPVAGESCGTCSNSNFLTAGSCEEAGHTWTDPDSDDDGWNCEEDCDDDNSAVHPGAMELCDGVDNDCDGELPPEEIDVDGDGCMVCEGDPDDSNPDDCEGSGDDDDMVGDDDDMGDDDDDSTPAPGVTVSGRVTDSMDSGHEGIGLTLCSDANCLTATTDASGAFSFANMAADAWVIHNLNQPEVTGSYSVLDFSSFYDVLNVQDDAFDAGSFVIPEMSAWHLAEDLTSGGDITFYEGTADALGLSWTGALDFPLSATAIPAADLAIGAGVIPEAQWPGALSDKTPLAAYAFSPWETALEDEDGHFTFTWPLPAGADTSLTYGFLVANYLEDITSGQFTYVAATLNAATGSISADFHHLSMLLPVHD